MGTVKIVGEMKLGKRENHEKNLKNPNNAHQTEIQTPDPIRFRLEDSEILHRTLRITWPKLKKRN